MTDHQQPQHLGKAVTLNEEVTQLTAAMANATEIREKATVQSHGRCCSKGVPCGAQGNEEMVLESAGKNMISQQCSCWMLIIWQAIITIRNYRYILLCLFILHCLVLFFMMNKELHPRSYQHHYSPPPSSWPQEKQKNSETVSDAKAGVKWEEFLLCFFVFYQKCSKVWISKAS